MSLLPFNYIVTIHNKEDLLDRVLAGIAECAGPDARIIPVLDGCTDGSEAIARRFAASAPVETVVLTAPDVHEIITINNGLRHAKPGYCVFVQDDVIIQEPRLEPMIHELCEKFQRRLGYISFRMGADVRLTPWMRRLRPILRYGLRTLLPHVEVFDLTGYPGEHLDSAKVPYGSFEIKMVGIKSPVCVTPELREDEPFLDETLAPYCYDDVDLSLRALKRGLRNGLFPIRFESNVEWRGTGKDPGFATFGEKIRLRNRRIIWRKHGALIKSLNRQRRQFLE